MKFLIHFEKGEPVRWLGHLDILRTFERAIRRAELPIAFTTGFNPREKIAFASALSVGITGAAEPATIELSQAIPPNDLVCRLNDKLPPGIRILRAEEIADAGSRDLLNSFVCAELQAVCSAAPGVTLDTAQRAADGLLAQDMIPVDREREGRIKQVDIRPLVRWIRAEALEGDRLKLSVGLKLGQEGTAKIGEVVGALAAAIPGLSLRRAQRIRLLTAEDSASMLEGGAPPPPAFQRANMTE